MGLTSRFLRLPRPKRFFYGMTLSTGASLITLSLLLNKLSGLFGILALLTGFDLSAFQLTMYIYSILALGLTIYLQPHIRKQSPLQCLVLAWFYVLDSVINAAYTSGFAVTWFMVLAQHSGGEGRKKGPGASMVDNASGFTSPQYNVSKVDVVASPQPGLSPGQDAVAAGYPADSPAGLGAAVFGSESMNSIGIIVAMWTLRVYFCFIMLAFARMVIRRHIANHKFQNYSYSAASSNAELVENPFSESKPEGQGWTGKLGRVLLAIFPSYWLGKDEDDSWMYGMRSKQGVPGGIPLTKVESGPAERERRRRSGTDPPIPDWNGKPPVAGDMK